MFEIFPKEKFNFMFEVDKEGFLINYISIHSISPLNKQVLDTITSYCLLLYGYKLISVYFRGSQLLSTYQSDFAIVIVLSEVDNFGSKELSNYLSSKMTNQYFHIIHFDTLVLTKSEIINKRKFSFVIKVLAVLFWGEDIGLLITAFRPNKEINFDLVSILSKRQLFLETVTAQQQESFKSIANYFIKYLLRCAFQLVIDKENVYTRGISLSHFYFIKYFPEHNELSYKLLNKYDKVSKFNNEFYTICIRMFDILEFELFREIER